MTGDVKLDAEEWLERCKMMLKLVALGDARAAADLENNLSLAAREWNTRPSASVVALPDGGGGWIVSNAAQDKFRMWGQTGPEWTSDREKALQFVRRDDAEAFAAEDEDAWHILPVGDAKDSSSRDFQLMLSRFAYRAKKGLPLTNTIAQAEDLLHRKGTLSPLRTDEPISEEMNILPWERAPSDAAGMREFPEGWQLVPKEPDWQQRVAGRNAIISDKMEDDLAEDISTDEAASAYRAMLEAAPLPSAPQTEERE